MKVEIYTDGSCLGNPGPGGWGAILKYGKNIKEISGSEPETTNNRMELLAVIQGLSALKRQCDVTVISDSSYMKNGITKWIYNWEKNGWKNSSKKEVKNKDLWLLLKALQNKHSVEWIWVKGHSGHRENERADELARQAAEHMKQQI